MDDQVVCQICGTAYPAGVTYCDSCCCEIQDVQGSWEADDEIANASDTCQDSADSDIDAHAFEEEMGAEGQVQCPECGCWGEYGGQCPQCMAPMPESVGLVSSAKRHVAVRLPNGRSLLLEAGSVVVIGRESPDELVKESLEGFPVISRRHCILSVSADGASVEITDLGSLNGTWVGDSCDYLCENETRNCELPVTVGLGRRLRMRIEIG